MKTIKKLSFLLLMALMAVSCIDKTPDYGNFPT